MSLCSILNLHGASQRRRLCGVAFGLVLLVAPVASWAQATRTWVSGVGDDANPCSRTAPCKTFAGAISKTAAGGEISVLDPGGYGALTISKAITIDGGGGFVSSILTSGTNGIVIVAGANDNVILRNLSLNGTGSGLAGISFRSGRSLRLQNVKVDRFTGPGLSVVVSNSGALSTPVVVEVLDSVFSNNGTGLFAASQPGSHNPVSVSVERSRFILGTTGLWSSGAGATVQAANSTIFGNSQGLSTASVGVSSTPSPAVTGSSGSLITFGNNQVQGNANNGSFTGTASNN